MEELVKRAKEVDFSAFEEIFLREKDYVYSLLLRLLDHEEDVKDAFQDVFIKVYRGLPKLKNTSSFKNWLYKIVVNTARNYMKPESISLEEIKVEKLADISGDPHRLLENKKLREFLERAIKKLPEKYRIPFVLRDIEKLPVKEIAEILGISENLVKVRVHRARMFLREEVSGFLTEG